MDALSSSYSTDAPVLPGTSVLDDAKFRAFAVLAVAFNTGLLLLLIFRPFDRSSVVTIDNCAQFVGPLLVLPLCVPGPRTWMAWLGRRQPVRRQDFVGLLLGLGIFSFAAGQMVWSYYELVLHQSTPFPSLADVFFMAEYPFLMLGILFLPNYRLTSTFRWRVSIDSFMLLAAVITFSWYFVLGPTLMQGGESILAQVIGTSYPAWDLAIVACLFVVFAHRRAGISGATLLLLCGGMAAMVLADTLFDYTTLHNTYQTGALLDVGWPLSCMILGLAAYYIRQERFAEEVRPTTRTLSDSARWVHYLPYASVPALGALLFYVTHNAGPVELRSGVELGTGIVVALVLARQILAIEENRGLWRRLAQKNAELESANQRLESLATTDPLTGLPNHRAMVAALDLELERAYRYHRPCSVLFADVDHFKELNDSKGHASGDAALTFLAALMRETLRGIDIVGRWGGEEFVVVLPETDASTAVEAAERLRKAIAGTPIVVPGGTGRLTVSIGVAAYPQSAIQRESLLDAADQAMYGAKRLGRNQVRLAGDSSLAVLRSMSGNEVVLQHAASLRMVEALASLVEARDLHTGQHAEQVAHLAMRVAERMGCGISETNLIGLAAKLHDVGKIGVPDAVLQKRGGLSRDEWRLVREHPIVGSEIIGRLPELHHMAPIVRGHHERWDGTGYPDGLKHSDIPVGARILAAADAFCAMTTTRPYREAISEAEAMGELFSCAGTQFDPEVIAVLAQVLNRDEESEAEAG